MRIRCTLYLVLSRIIWNISEENFFKSASALSFISNLKIRGSYGQVGNQGIDPYSYTASIQSGIDYPFGPEGGEFLGVGAVSIPMATGLIQNTMASQMRSFKMFERPCVTMPKS